MKISQKNQSFHLSARKPTISKQHTLPASSDTVGRGETDVTASMFTCHILVGEKVHMVPGRKRSSLSL